MRKKTPCIRRRFHDVLLLNGGWHCLVFRRQIYLDGNSIQGRARATPKVAENERVRRRRNVAVGVFRKSEPNPSKTVYDPNRPVCFDFFFYTADRAIPSGNPQTRRILRRNGKANEIRQRAAHCYGIKLRRELSEIQLTSGPSCSDDGQNSRRHIAKKKFVGIVITVVEWFAAK